jgi:hypothetical protein
LVVLAAAAVLVGAVSGWARVMVFDAGRFADRVTSVLDTSTGRSAVADAITVEVLRVAPDQLVNYRPLVGVAVQTVVATDAFHQVFRRALVAAHRATFIRDSSSFLLDLTASLDVLRSTIAIVAPDAARQAGFDAKALRIDLTEQIDGLALWRVVDNLRMLESMALAVAVTSAALAITLASPRRRMVVWLGSAVVVDGFLVVVLATVLPAIGASLVGEDQAEVVRAGVASFAAGLRAAGVILAGAGVLVVAVATARRDRAERSHAERLGHELRRLATRPVRPVARAARGVGLVVAGVVMAAAPSVAVTVLAMAAGTTLAYLGLLEVVAVVGRDATPARPETATVPVATRGPRRSVALAGPAVLVAVAFVSAGLLYRMGIGEGTPEAATLECNGHQELCDRRLDEVTFAGTHNSMSASSEPGWLFAENRGGIAAQLEFGIRALLVDVYYGVSSPVNAPGTSQPLIVTDRAKTLAAGLRFGAANDDEPAEAQERAAELARTSPSAPDAPRGLYLCHNWCELGATPFPRVLETIRRFLDANPTEVLLLFVEDYVAAPELAAAFDQAGLGPRLLELGRRGPLPTLREAIDAGRTLVVLSEHSGPPPGWYHRGFELFQDTPYFFRSVGDLACGANRGPPDAPLFLVNHWLSTGAPNPAHGRRMNTEQVLTDRVERCQRERGRKATIVAVDWFDEGDLLDVVDQLNNVR